MIDLFPTPLYIEPITIEETHWDNIRMESCGNGRTSSNRNILNLFPLLLQEVQQHVDKYIQLTGHKTKVNITSSWLNFHGYMDFAQTHYHANSIISGVVFIDVPPNSGNFCIRKPHSFTKDFCMVTKLDTTHPTPYNAEEFIYEPQVNTIALFPSVLQHDVTPNYTDYRRITLAFDCTPAELCTSYGNSPLNISYYS